MKGAILFWLAQHLVNLGLALAMFLIIALAHLPRVLRQALCRHDGRVWENGACDAICRECGKNLGFIGTWRAKRKEAS